MISGCSILHLLCARCNLYLYLFYFLLIEAPLDINFKEWNYKPVIHEIIFPRLISNAKISLMQYFLFSDWVPFRNPYKIFRCKSFSFDITPKSIFLNTTCEIKVHIWEPLFNVSCQIIDCKFKVSFWNKTLQ